MQNIVTFFGANNLNGEFSNWYPSPLKIKLQDVDYQFQNVEQAMMASKAVLMGDIPSFQKILNQPDPKKAKALGRKVQNFNPALWDKHKVAIVTVCVRAKFMYNPILLSKLLATGDAILAETSPYDDVWGTGSKSKNPKFWKGQNLLGKILVDVRSKLRPK